MADIDFYNTGIDENYHTCFSTLTKDIGKNFSSFKEKNEMYKESYPMHYAVAVKDINLLNLLLNAGISTNQVNKDGFTPLHVAVDCGNEEMVDVLLTHGAKAEVKDIFGRTALFLTLCTSCLDRRKMTRIAKLILDSHIDPKALLNNGTYSGEIALHWAIENDLEEMALLLLKYGANMNLKDRNGKNSLFFSIQFNRVKVAKFLLKNGAKVNDKMNNGMVILHEAVKQRAEKCIQLLLRYGADVNARDIYGMTPLHLSVQFYYLDERKMDRIVKLLLNNGAVINDTSTTCGETAFQSAIINGNEKLVKLFIKYGADLNSKNIEGKSPLHYAVQYSNKNIVKLLLNKGARIDNRTIDGKLALHVAVAVEDENIIRILLEYNADVNSVDKSGKTPLSLAFEVALMRSIYNPWNGFYPNHLEIGCNSNIFELLVKYIAKLKYICNENLRMMSMDDKLYLFYLQCRREIVKMKEINNICDNISLYKVLTRSDDALIGYARNKNLYDVIYSDMYECVFPIYYNILKERFNRANKRKTLLESGVKSFTMLIKPYYLPEIVKVKILNYLPSDDLKNLNLLQGDLEF